MKNNEVKRNIFFLPLTNFSKLLLNKMIIYTTGYFENNFSSMQTKNRDSCLEKLVRGDDFQKLTTAR